VPYFLAQFSYQTVQNYNEQNVFHVVHPVKCNKEYKRRCKEKKSNFNEGHDHNLQEEDMADLIAADDVAYTENYPWQCNV